MPPALSSHSILRTRRRLFRSAAGWRRRMRILLFSVGRRAPTSNRAVAKCAVPGSGEDSQAGRRGGQSAGGPCSHLEGDSILGHLRGPAPTLAAGPPNLPLQGTNKPAAGAVHSTLAPPATDPDASASFLQCKASTWVKSKKPDIKAATEMNT